MRSDKNTTKGNAFSISFMNHKLAVKKKNLSSKGTGN